MCNNIIKNIVELFQTKIIAPKPYGIFHFIWIIATISLILFLYKTRDSHTEKRFKILVGIYAGIEVVLEIIKQIAYSTNINNSGLITWDYRWQSFPFQLCSTPVIIGLIVVLMKKSKFRSTLLSYISYITILGSIFTILFPWKCLVDTLFVSVHTMWLHCGSLVLSIYFIFTKEVEINIKSWKKAIPIFLFFVTIADILNIIIYNLGVLENGERFDMFYISPYFTSTLAVFDIIHENTPYFIFLTIYILSVILGSFIIFCIYKRVFENITNSNKENNCERRKSIKH